MSKAEENTNPTDGPPVLRAELAKYGQDSEDLENGESDPSSSGFRFTPNQLPEFPEGYSEEE